MVQSVIKILKSKKFSLHNEKQLQAEIYEALTSAGISAIKEHRFNAQDIPDFFIDGICLEIKIKGNAKSIYRQLERYAQHDTVSVIILATNRTMGLPQSINGKDCYLVKFGENWL